MRKLKNIAKRFINKNSLLYKILSKIYHTLSTMKYKITNGKKIRQEKAHYSEVAKEALNIIDGFNKKDYIVFYNPTWLGVAASTKGLFTNYVPLEHVYKRQDINSICKRIVDNEIKTVIFSQLCDGWIELINGIKAIDDKVTIGNYNADSRELKNIYTALSAMKLIPNAKADVVPINGGAAEFAKLIELEYDSINDYIPNEELMKRIHKNDINVYPTFTENAPMFPLESFEMGVPCLLGNNNDYFVGTELGDYVILEKEDDPLYIKERIEYVLKNRDHVMELYREWKKDFDKKCDKWVDEFIK